MFKKVLIANRGAIACRIQRSLRALDVASVAVYAEADADARHVLEADEAYFLGPSPPAESYLNAGKLLAIARDCGAEAIHPGYGFLSENADFAEACETAGLAFIGPTPAQMRVFGLKHSARALAASNRVPLLPGSGLLRDVADATRHARRIGYPLMMKSTAGGGGIGMRLIRRESELGEAYAAVDRLARANFEEPGIYLEKYVEHARHIEVQLFGDGLGQVIALGERDCSVQRRNQKVIEETPAPGLDDGQRLNLADTAIRLGRAVRYRSAGTVEFVLDVATGDFYFLEVNTRLQVEHGVTEAVTGVDLVAWMVRLAAGSLPPLECLDVRPRGAAMQARLYAEDPHKHFQPSAGLLTAVRFPTDIRVDGWVQSGTVVPPHYDPMLAKLIAHGADREAARTQLLAALQASEVAGIETNRAYLAQVLACPDFVAGRQTTRLLERFEYHPSTIDVLEPGLQSTLQDWPGRQGYWSVGVPPSGPVDSLSHRLANRLLGNAEGAASLEITAAGPILRFNCDAVVALTGAALDATMDGAPFEAWRAQAVKAGSKLCLGPVVGAGLRAYLAVLGGFQVPTYLGSRATFTLGQFGGHGGRTLRAGDVLQIVPANAQDLVDAAERAALPETARPTIGSAWDIAVLYGPHGAPDFFTDTDIAGFFATDWEVHYNSSRTGVRLIGPKPQWARSDGGEAGLHPSNIHDNPYAVGAVDFTGDMPVILGPDGPSLGGFVCPATVVQADLWKLGQLKPGDRVRFHCSNLGHARALQVAQDAAIASLRPMAVPSLPDTAVPVCTPLLHLREATEGRAAFVIRQSGDANLLIEIGPLILDLELRMRIQALMQALQQARADGRLTGVLDLTPGIRSLQVHFDPNRIDRATLIRQVLVVERALPDGEDLEVDSRTVFLPLSWDDPSTRLAIDKYMQSVRPDAPWCPSNIEFIRRINGLATIEEVARIVFEASYLVMGLGDVYLGAPVATPIDPRHRLVTTKYNPARTWTPENAVGIGGAYLCVYGMEGPGGYQFVGRTVQMWNRYRATGDFSQPWLLRFFDRVRFYPVSEEQLVQMREDFIAGKFRLRIEAGRFRMKEYREFLVTHAASITDFKRRQQTAFEAERERWTSAGHDAGVMEQPAMTANADDRPPRRAGSHALTTPVSGSVWKLTAAIGDRVHEGAPLVIVESMKMEIALVAPCNGTLTHLFCREGAAVATGQELLIIDEGE